MLEPGNIIGNYRVIRLLGKGGMGFVYLVKHLTLGVEYAMKVLKDDAAENDEYVARFLREGKLASHIRHPNLIAVYDAGRDARNGLYYLVMDYVSGGTLAERIRKDGALPPQQALAIVRQVALALGAASAKGLVHRDIKPANIMFDAEGRVRVADLGIAKGHSDDETTVTHDNAVFGTPAYMSPEQARDTGKVDVRSDIYSLGVVLWHVLTGVRPYADSTVMAIIVSLLDKNPLPDVRERNPAVPQEVSELVRDMCAKDVNRRVQSPQELIRRIDALTMPAGEPTLATVVTPTAIPPQVARPRHSVWRAIAVACLVCGMLGLATWFAFRFRQRKTEVTVDAPLAEPPAQTEMASVEPSRTENAGVVGTEEKPRAAEEETRRKVMEEERRKAVEDVVRQKAAEDAAARQKAAEEESRRQAARRAAEVAAARRAEDAQRLAAEAAARKAETERQAAERKRLEDEARLAAAAMAQSMRAERSAPERHPLPQVVRVGTDEVPSRDYAKLALSAFEVGNWSLGYQYACQDETGNAEVLFWLGKCFDPGVDMPGFRHKKDAARARDYYRRAAARGSTAAQERIRHF